MASKFNGNSKLLEHIEDKYLKQHKFIAPNLCHNRQLWYSAPVRLNENLPLGAKMLYGILTTVAMLGFFAEAAFAGFASNPHHNNLRQATHTTAYYWMEHENILRGKCIPGKEINVENCMQDHFQLQIVNFEVLEEQVASLLQQRMASDPRRQQLLEKNKLLDQKAEFLRAATASPHARSLLATTEAQLSEIQDALAGLVTPDQVAAEFIQALRSPPENVFVAGDGSHPLAEGHIDLLNVIFQLIPPVGAVNAWCQDLGGGKRRLWSHLAAPSSVSTMQDNCGRMNARAPQFNDLFDATSDDDVDEYLANNTCSVRLIEPHSVRFAAYRPLAASTAKKFQIWLDAPIGVATTLTIEGNEICAVPAAGDQNPKQSLDTFCVLDLSYLPREFSSEAIARLPCGHSH